MAAVAVTPRRARLGTYTHRQTVSRCRGLDRHYRHDDSKILPVLNVTRDLFITLSAFTLNRICESLRVKVTLIKPEFANDVNCFGLKQKLDYRRT